MYCIHRLHFISCTVYFFLLELIVKFIWSIFFVPITNLPLNFFHKNETLFSMFRPIRSSYYFNYLLGDIPSGGLPPPVPVCTGYSPGLINSQHWHLCLLLACFLDFRSSSFWVNSLMDSTLQELPKKEYREGKNFKAANVIILLLYLIGQV